MTVKIGYLIIGDTQTNKLNFFIRKKKEGNLTELITSVNRSWLAELVQDTLERSELKEV